MTKRASLIQAYIAALDTSPLLVLAVAGKQPCRIASEPVEKLNIVDTFWFTKPQHAELVLQKCLSDLSAAGARCRGEWIDIPAADVCEALSLAARDLGAAYRSTLEVHQDAGKAVDRIVANVELARLRGQLRAVNAEYKAYRERQIAAGEKPVSYSQHLADFTLSLVVLAAKNTDAVSPG